MFGDAEADDRFMGRWSRLVAPLFLEFADIPDAGRVLDVGSGTGSLAFAIIPDGRRNSTARLGYPPASRSAFPGSGMKFNTSNERVR